MRLLKEATTPVTLVVTDPDTNRYGLGLGSANVKYYIITENSLRWQGKPDVRAGCYCNSRRLAG